MKMVQLLKLLVMKQCVKYIVALLVLTFYILPSFGQSNKKVNTNNVFEPSTKNAEIEIWLKGAQSGKARLYSVFGNQNTLKDSSIADANGKVVFKHLKPYPAGYYYAVYNDNTFVGFLINKNQKFYLHADKADVLQTFKTNSAENQLYFDNQIYETDLAKKIETLNASISKSKIGTAEHKAFLEEQKKLIEEKEGKIKSYLDNYPSSFFVKFKQMGQNPKLKEPKKANGDLDTIAQLMTYRNEYWSNYDFNDERLVRTPVYFNKLNTYLTNLFPQRVDSIMKGVKFIMEKVDKGNKEVFNFTVNYLLLTYNQSTVMGSEKIYCYVVDNFFTYKKAYWSDSTNIFRARLESDLMKPSLLGAIGQDLNCKNEKGDYVSLYSIKTPIKVVYLYNPDCEHCQKETPKLKALYDKWKSKGLEVYALNVEHEDDVWINYINKLGLNWVNVHDNKYESNYYKKYHMRQTPGLYVLDINNKIVAKQLMPDQLEAVFEYMLKK